MENYADIECSQYETQKQYTTRKKTRVRGDAGLHHNICGRIQILYYSGWTLAHWLDHVLRRWVMQWVDHPGPLSEAGGPRPSALGGAAQMTFMLR